jgi:Tol biopolymer transport system component
MSGRWSDRPMGPPARNPARQPRNPAPLIMVALVALVFALVAAAAGARPEARSGVIVYSSVRNISVGEPFQPGVFSDLYAVRADGRGFRRLTRTEGFSEEDPAWSPDGKLIAYSQGDPYCHAASCEWDPIAESIWLMAADGTDQRPLVNGDPERDYILEESPSWSPDSRELVFTRHNGIALDDPKDGIYIASADGKERRQISTVRAAQVAWSPRGDTIAYIGASDERVWLYHLKTGRKQKLRVTGMSPRSVGSLSWSGRGQFLALTNGKAVYIVRSSGGRARQVVKASSAGGTSWSPDGCCLVFSANPPAKTARSELYIVPIRGGRARRLTRNPGADIEPTWHA